MTGHGVSAKNDYFLTLKDCNEPYLSALIGFENNMTGRFPTHGGQAISKPLLCRVPIHVLIQPPATTNDSDIANLSDLDAFFDEEYELDPDLH